MKRIILRITTTLLVLMATGCALPTAHYVTYERQLNGSPSRTIKDAPADTFELATTSIKISNVEVKEDENQKFQIDVVRKGDPKVVFGITPNRKWYGVNTILSISKVANTALVDSITTEVEDKRIDFIKSAAKFVGTAVGVTADAASAQKPLKAPAIHDLQPLLDKNGIDKKTIEIDDGLQMEIEAVPADALELASLSGSMEKLSRAFIYSACRPAILRITADGKETLMNITVADSRYVQTVAFPLKGKISAHSQCGVSVVPEKTTLSSDIDVAQTALEELLKLRDSTDTQNSSDDNSAE